MRSTVGDRVCWHIFDGVKLSNVWQEKLKYIDCNIAIDHTSAYYSFTLNLQTPGHHINVVGLFLLIIVIWCYHILTFNSFKVLAVTLSRAMPSAHKQMGCILHGSGSNGRCSWSRILDSDTKWKSRAPWLPLVCCCTPAKTYAYLYPTANWMEYPSNRDQEASTHGIAEILASRAEKQYSQLLTGTHAWSFQTCTACCRGRPIHNAHQTHSHSSIQPILVFGSKKAWAIILLISLLEQKSLRMLSFPLPNRLLMKSARGYTVYSQLMLQALLKTKISASDQNEPSEQLEWVTLI